MNKILSSTKSFFAKLRRVWFVLKKPTEKEFEMIAKVSAIGILILGFLGFLIAQIVKLFV